MKNQISRRHFLVQASILASSLTAGLGSGLLAQAKAASKWDTKMELEIALEINQVDTGRRYQLPYVAVWLEDASGKTVRTLSVWYQQGRGDRWLPDLRRWYNANSSSDYSTISGPTRSPGTYKLVWDGKNDKKNLVDQGEYFVCIEAAREHGTYQLIRERLELGSAAFAKQFAGNVEIKSANATYRKA